MKFPFCMSGMVRILPSFRSWKRSIPSWGRLLALSLRGRDCLHFGEWEKVRMTREAWWIKAGVNLIHGSLEEPLSETGWNAGHVTALSRGPFHLVITCKLPLSKYKACLWDFLESGPGRYSLHSSPICTSSFTTSDISLMLWWQLPWRYFYARLKLILTQTVNHRV